MPPTPNAVPLSLRMRHVLINGLAFLLIYPLANLQAEQLSNVPSFCWPWETSIPFIDWMIIPYLSSGGFFIGLFFLVRNASNLRLFSQQLLFTTLVAGLCFTCFPLRFAFSHPPSEHHWLQFMYSWLAWGDRPFNQFPSLHVAYCLIFWQTLHKAFPRHPRLPLVDLWLLLVGLATLLTYQHHVVDVLGGLLLGFLALQQKTPWTGRQAVAFYYSSGAGLLLIVLVLLLKQTCGLYIVLSLGLVARAYQRGQADFLKKTDGRFPLWNSVLYAPYLLGYLLTWHGVRRKERHAAPFTEYRPNLFVGRRLTANEAAHLPAQCTVIDLANELSETLALRNTTYHYFPVLDLTTPDAALCQKIAGIVQSSLALHRPVFIHCAMGYSRSHYVAQAILNPLPNHS